MAERCHDDKHQVEMKRHSCQGDHRGWSLHCDVQGATWVEDTGELTLGWSSCRCSGLLVGLLLLVFLLSAFLPGVAGPVDAGDPTYRFLGSNWCDS